MTITDHTPLVALPDGLAATHTLFHGACGTGKTYGAVKFIKTLDPRKVVYVGPKTAAHMGYTIDVAESFPSDRLGEAIEFVIDDACHEPASLIVLIIDEIVHVQTQSPDVLDVLEKLIVEGYGLGVVVVATDQVYAPHRTSVLLHRPQLPPPPVMEGMWQVVETDWPRNPPRITRGGLADTPG